MSTRAKRIVNGLLTGAWLVGAAVILEYWDASLLARAAVVALLLAAVVVIEVAIVRWNEGHWPLRANPADGNGSNAESARL